MMRFSISILLCFYNYRTFLEQFAMTCQKSLSIEAKMGVTRTPERIRVGYPQRSLNSVTTPHG